jgi:T5SS/PEP-CTERM-associated repeat protein
MNGGTVSNGSCIMGTFSGTGTATVEGTGSTWTNDGDLIVGNIFDGVGMVTISDGAQVTNSNGFLGFDSSANGTVEIDGAGSTWTNGGNLYIGGTESGAARIGAVHIAVAQSYDRLRTTFFSTLDETLAHCANDAEMFFVCAHINVSPAARCLDLRCRKIVRSVEGILKISPANTCALPQPKFSAFARIADGGRSCSLRTWGDKSRRIMMKGY